MVESKIYVVTQTVKEKVAWFLEEEDAIKFVSDMNADNALAHYEVLKS